MQIGNREAPPARGLALVALAVLAAIACAGAAAPPNPVNGVRVSVEPTSASVLVDQTQQFTATVESAADTTVTWTATGGTVASGLYTAPGSTGTFTVTATSVADPTKSASATVTVTAARAATPTFNPAAGTYASAQSVTLSCTTGSSTIYYTTDGSTPTHASSAYGAALTVSTTTTVKAICAASGQTDSAIATAVYTIGSSSNLQKLQKLATKVGIFMHKSVGQNIIDGDNADGHGMRSVWAANPGSGWTVGGDRGWATLPVPGSIRDLSNLYGPTTTSGVRLLNMIGGEDGFPLQKTADMDGLLRSGFGAKLNASVDAQGHPNGYAFLKWCFTDFAATANNTPRQAYDDYKAKLHAWKALWPNIHFLHVTVPLTFYNSETDNPHREQMNQLMRNDPELVADGLWDLADAESVCNGTSCQAGTAAGAHDGTPTTCNNVANCSYDSAGNRMLRQAYAPTDYVHPNQPAEEDWLGQKLIDFLYEHL